MKAGGALARHLLLFLQNAPVNDTASFTVLQLSREAGNVGVCDLKCKSASECILPFNRMLHLTLFTYMVLGKIQWTLNLARQTSSLIYLTLRAQRKPISMEAQFQMEDRDPIISE